MKKLILLFAICNISCSSFITQKNIVTVNETVTKSDIEGHIYFLASDELKGRETGTPEIDIAALYLANTLRRYNVKPMGENNSYYQNVPINKTTAATKISILINGQSSNKLIQTSGGNIEFDGDVIFLNYGLEEEYKTVDVKGKVVCVLYGLNEKSSLRESSRARNEKNELAKKYGAKGIIELSKLDNDTWIRFEHSYKRDKLSLKSTGSTPEAIPHFLLNDLNSSFKNLFSKSKQSKISLAVTGVETKTIFSKNVVGMVEGADPKLKEEFIIYSAHYDHNGVGKPNAENDSIYNGARDNAVGTVTVLSAAKNIAKYPTKRSALFILFTAEEKGLLGSQYYVENPVLPLNKMVFCFNSDNGGYNDTSLATIVGLERTTESELIIEAAKEFGLKAIQDPSPGQGLFNRSDNVHFARKGIPAPTFSLGFSAFDDEINKYYHQVTDNPDNLDYDYLLKFFKSYVLSCRLIGDNPKTPFWTEGDSYYEQGLQLYKKQ
jgi:hypothetical protein